MSLLETFDAAIAASEKLKSGYDINGRSYPGYLSNEAWNTWLSGMSQDHRCQFDNGSGGELQPKNGRPPKMASFASSSRLIYKLSKDIPGFRFEKQLPTRIGGIANLDGYLEREDKLIYIEAKCREPYSHAAIQTIKQNYKPLYCYLREKMPRVFSCVMEDIPNSRDMRVVFFCKGRIVPYFDIKQMICHMLGIANEMLNASAAKPVSFVYLLFDPSYLELPEERKDVILAIYKDTCQAANDFNFSEMFGHIADYLIRENKMVLPKEKSDRIKESFHFQMADQITYRKLIEE